MTVLTSLLEQAPHAIDAATAVGSGLVPAAWDIVSFLNNSKNLAVTIGGALLGVLGIIGLIVAVVQMFSKLFSDQSRRSWVSIIVLFLISGAVLSGGIILIQNMSSGAQTTIEQLGLGV